MAFALRELLARESARTDPPTFLEKYAIAWFTAAFAFINYSWVGRLSAPAATFDLTTSIDTAIPFLPWTVWIYLVFFAFVFHVGVWSIASRANYGRTAASLLLASAVAFAWFLALPAAYPRPLQIPATGATLALMQFLHTIDPPNNTFPSLHVTYLFVVALGAWRDNAKRGRIVLLLAVLPMLSILTTKQHFVADLLGGLVLGFICHRLCFKQKE
jgi:membrane-associated phospholipid phosphatase